jgi:hypothetical protein
LESYARPPYCVLEKQILSVYLADTLNDEIRGIDSDLQWGIRYKVVHSRSTMVEVDLYISAYSCLMADQTRTSQYVEVVLGWLRKQSDP